MSNSESANPAELAARFVNYTSKHIFLTGKAGTGKTTFLRRLIELTHKKAVIAAPTGIAAINAAGVTIHSLFQLPFGTYLPKQPDADGDHYNQQYNTPKSIVRHLNMTAAKRKVIIDMELLIIDEVSMLRADLLDAIDMILRYIRRNNSVSFGGVQVLFIGDLHQLPPVVKSTEWNLLGQFYKSAYFFDALALQNNPPIYIELEKIYRQADEVFINLLNNLRNNTVTAQDVALLEKYYKADFKPSINDKYITLTTHNNKADTLNKQSLEELKAASYLYVAKIEDDFSEYSYPAEHILELKVGAQVMFIKNDPTGEQRFFNGKIAVVTALKTDLIEVQAEGSNEKIILEKYTWKNIKYTTDKVTGEIHEDLAGTFTQYPLKLAWAITVHKSQGLTFEKAIIDIGNAFAPGQIYVALSRLRSLDGLILTSLISGSGIRQDQNVSFFSRNKQEPARLEAQIKEESDAFLRSYLLQCFDLNPLDNYVYDHVHSYTKDINKSAKQKHHKWAAQLLKDLSELKAHANKFLGQIQRLSQVKTEEGLSALFDRTVAAENYFNPLLSGFSKRIFERMELVKQDKQVVAFLTELLEMEGLFYEQVKKISKATALLKATINGVEFTKKDVSELIDQAKRASQMEKVFAMPGKLDFTEKKSKTSKPKSGVGKAKIEKAPKVDTKELSLVLLKEGKTIAEIAAERKMVIGTIEGHLAHYVARQEVSAKDIIGSKKLDKILDAITELKTLQMNPIRDYLGRDYSFGEIKIGVAAHLAER
ncbi:helix-turn-helix domain-containing protein [Pedobacter panaciterrae]|jgi:ATP-dependent exoDNAse (exonuclease V), alpha subunit - helicase superfamily I member|uniref:helix-turn-helix domain-containing protein n=1 Tax=Pedobacter panaciterrae TaxID=363849 RepID=UPI00155DD572|nr:helix-turn-helix domain-containing protein [Pedobacter panaciterrae]NQX55018.1 helix-turn-helix domain-containing protein [Pedobacter panaciterrae]